MWTIILCVCVCLFESKFVCNSCYYKWVSVLFLFVVCPRPLTANVSSSLSFRKDVLHTKINILLSCVISCFYTHTHIHTYMYVYTIQYMYVTSSKRNRQKSITTYKIKEWKKYILKRRIAVQPNSLHPKAAENIFFTLHFPFFFIFFVPRSNNSPIRTP